MPQPRIGTREEWQTARDELAKLEAEHAKLGQKVTEQRRQLPWVPVEKEYRFDTEEGEKTLAENKAQVDAILERFGGRDEAGGARGMGSVVRAMMNLRAATRLRLRGRAASPEQIQAIVDALDTAAKTIERI